MSDEEWCAERASWPVSLLKLVVVGALALVALGAIPPSLEADAGLAQQGPGAPGFATAQNVCVAYRVGGFWSGAEVRAPDLVRYRYLAPPPGPAILWLPNHSPFRVDFLGMDPIPDEGCGWSL